MKVASVTYKIDACSPVCDVLAPTRTTTRIKGKLKLFIQSVSKHLDSRTAKLQRGRAVTNMIMMICRSLPLPLCPATNLASLSICDTARRFIHALPLVHTYIDIVPSEHDVILHNIMYLPLPRFSGPLARL